MPENPFRRNFLSRMAGLGIAGAALGADASPQSAPAAGGEFHLPEYACAQDYRSLKQSSFDRTGGNADRWASSRTSGSPSPRKAATISRSWCSACTGTAMPSRA
jgi:hypothetical protein